MEEIKINISSAEILNLNEEPKVLAKLKSGDIATLTEEGILITNIGHLIIKPDKVILSEGYMLKIRHVEK